MKQYEINIAKRYIVEGWDGKPKHKFFARLHLDEGITEGAAISELERLQRVYPWPEYSLSLRQIERVTHWTQIVTTDPEGN